MSKSVERQTSEQQTEKPEKEQELIDEVHVLNGEDALSRVCTLSDIAYNITTPTGKVLKCRSKFIGLHSNNLLLIECPSVSPQEFGQFFQRGYPVKACAISQKGEGARIYFKSKVEYVVQAGLNNIVVLSLPSATQMAYGLRSEARLDISLEGILDPNEKNHLCEVRDISSSGCQIVVNRTVNEYKTNSIIELQILSDSSENCAVLQGVIKNKKRSLQYWKYGVLFDDSCIEATTQLLEALSFDEAQHRFLL